MTTQGNLAAQFALHRYDASLPSRWGPPEGTRNSPERASWIRRMLDEHELSAAERRAVRTTARRYPTDRAAVELRLAFLRIPGPGGY